MQCRIIRNAQVLALSALVQACSSTVRTDHAGAGGHVGAGGASAGAGGTVGASSGSGGGGGSSGAGGYETTCDSALVQAIAQETSLIGSCTAIVRLDFTTLTPLGFAIICGPYATVTESQARQRTILDAGIDTAGDVISGVSEDEFIFHKSPSDFGGVSAVSARNGLTMFGGTIVWDGQGMVTYPKTWRAPAELDFGCWTPTIATPPMRTFVVTETQWTPEGPSSKEALDAVWHSVLPLGLAQSGHIFDAVALLYPRTVGFFDPSTAEWIVLVNAGSLN